jgi:hypothetical protein
MKMVVEGSKEKFRRSLKQIRFAWNEKYITEFECGLTIITNMLRFSFDDIEDNFAQLSESEIRFVDQVMEVYVRAEEYEPFPLNFIGDPNNSCFIAAIKNKMKPRYLILDQLIAEHKQNLS